MKQFHLRKTPPSSPIDYHIDYESALNQQQLSAVTSPAKRLLLLAGAGTGKTKTLIYKVSRLIESGVPPEQIVLLTFTRRAAKEMMERATQLLDERCQYVQGGTFHSFCTQILRKYSNHIGYNNEFSIIDSADSIDLIQHVRSTLNIDHRSQRFPAKRSLAKLFTLHKNKQLDMRVLLQEYYPQFLVHEKDVIRLFKTYESYKAKHHIMDFDDLLFNTEKLFIEYPAILERVSSTCQYVLVDEFQDTNKIQASLCEYFSSFHQNLTVVGDDAQSIYAFRGSDYENILRFPEEHANTELIKLEENYRSSPEILEVANAVLKQSSILFKKKLFTNRESSDLPALIKAIDDKEEAEFISQLVLHLREHQITLGEVAVLFRNARDSFTLELALQSKDIPFKKFGGQKFTEAAHIKDVLAHIRILSNPNDTVAWQRVLMLIEGVGPKTAEDLFLWIQEVQSKQGGASTTDSTHWFSDSEWMNKNYYNGLNRLGSCLINASKCTPWHDSVPIIVDYYLPICKDLYDDASKREEDLASLLQIAKTYQDIQSFLTDLVLEPITDTVTDTLASREEEAPLTLSTIHSAKGLEWKHVLIMQCLDGSIPSTFSIDNEESLDEELRLLYVATTRAKEMLYFTYPRTSFRQREGDYLTKASRFLDPITANLEPWELIHDTHDPNLNESNKPPLLE